MMPGVKDCVHGGEIRVWHVVLVVIRVRSGVEMLLRSKSLPHIICTKCASTEMT